ncbi:MAG: tetratricopeptide repeat-containing protein [Labilithrix sp.]|nr:tetratricopeptide repeat-containing protein [Labilithrix sp.]MCW5815953.1 tetratricopeptide repeat-containing protein [Labilithrix sp.]
MRERAAAAAAALFFFAAAARANEPPPTPEHEAVFRAGMEQYEKGNRPAAIATWENLLATLGEGRGYKILYNLGVAYQASGDVTRAIERYRAFVAQVKRRENVGKDLVARSADATTRLEQLESTHGAVDVRAPKSGPIVLTRVGTSEPRPAGYVVWLAPGTHAIEVNVGTQKIERREVIVEKGKTVVVDTSPPEEPAPPPPAPPPEPPPPRGVSAWVWVGAGVTLASVALPVASYLVADGKGDDARALGRGSGRYADAKDTYETWRTLHYVSYAVPAVLAGITIAIAVLGPSKRVTVGFDGSQLRVGGAF